MHDPCQIQIDCSAIERFKTGENGTFKQSKCRAHGDEVPRRNPSGYVSPSGYASGILFARTAREQRCRWCIGNAILALHRRRMKISLPMPPTWPNARSCSGTRSEPDKCLSTSVLVSRRRIISTTRCYSMLANSITQLTIPCCASQTSATIA
jgi:hypothetical protein